MGAGGGGVKFSIKTCRAVAAYNGSRQPKNQICGYTMVAEVGYLGEYTIVRYLHPSGNVCVGLGVGFVVAFRLSGISEP